MPKVRIIGIDPGLRNTGWGVIEVEGSGLSYVADGSVHSDADAPLAIRLLQIHTQLANILAQFLPFYAAIEETFVNIAVSEYAPNVVKKSVVGAGHAEKDQVKHMVKILLPRAEMKSADSTDALAIAICHAHHRGVQTLTRKLARS